MGGATSGRRIVGDEGYRYCARLVELSLSQTGIKGLDDG